MEEPDHQDHVSFMIFSRQETKCDPHAQGNVNKKVFLNV